MTSGHYLKTLTKSVVPPKIFQSHGSRCVDVIELSDDEESKSPHTTYEKREFANGSPISVVDLDNQEENPRNVIELFNEQKHAVGFASSPRITEADHSEICGTPNLNDENATSRKSPELRSGPYIPESQEETAFISEICPKKQPVTEHAPYAGPSIQYIDSSQHTGPSASSTTSVTEAVKRNAAPATTEKANTQRAPEAYMGPHLGSEKMIDREDTQIPGQASSVNIPAQLTNTSITSPESVIETFSVATTESDEKENLEASFDRQETNRRILSEMAEILRQRQELKSKADQQTGVSSKAGRGAQLRDRNGKYNFGSSKLARGREKTMTVAEDRTSHMGPNGYQMGMAALGMGDPAVLNAVSDTGQASDQQYHRQPPPAESSHPGLFVRTPTPPPANLKRRRLDRAGLRGTYQITEPDKHQKNSQRDLKLDDFWGPNKPQAKKIGSVNRYSKPITLNDNHGKSWEERKETLKARADRENRAFEEGYNVQEIDLNFKEYDRSTAAMKLHPTKGGKGLSEETLRRWQVGQEAHAYPTPSSFDVGEEMLDYPKLLYEYHVQRRVTLNGQQDDEGRLTSFGPFYTIGEANAMATNWVRQHDPEDTSPIMQRGGWSYNYEKDETGMEVHTLKSGGGSIQTWVSRSISHSDEGIGVPVRAYTTPSWLYVAMQCNTASTPSITRQDLAEQPASHPGSSVPCNGGRPISILKAGTLLDLANRAAGEKWIELQSANLPKDGLGEISRLEMEMNLRHDLECMKKENISFERAYRDPHTGHETIIWVEMVEVAGPRN